MITTNQMIVFGEISGLGFAIGLIVGWVSSLVIKRRAAVLNKPTINPFEFVVRKFYHDSANILKTKDLFQQASGLQSLAERQESLKIYEPLIESLRGLTEYPTKRESLEIGTLRLTEIIIAQLTRMSGVSFIQHSEDEGASQSQTVRLATSNGLQISISVLTNKDLDLTIPRSFFTGLSNVITNALKFVDPTTGRITIDIGIDTIDYQLRAVVADNGSGMTEETASKLYKESVKSYSCGLGRGAMMTAIDISADGGSICLVKNISRPTKEALFDRGTATALTVPFRLASE